MSGPNVHIATNSLGAGDYTVVTMNGERIFEGEYIFAKNLHDIMEIAGGCEFLTFHEFSDEEMNEWLTDN